MFSRCSPPLLPIRLLLLIFSCLSSLEYHFPSLTMKAIISFLFVLSCLAVLPGYAQFDYTPDSLKVTTFSFQKPFPVVWKAVMKAIKQKGCAVESQKRTMDDATSMYSGNIRSEACVLISGEDSTREVLMRWGKVPLIRGGVWVSGRAQYNFAVKDMPDKTVQVVLTVEISGKEDFITKEVHFWNSNGILDDEMAGYLKAAVDAVAAQKN